MRERSDTVSEALRYVDHLHVKLFNSALAKNVPYTKLRNWDKLLMYSLKSTKLSRVFESQPDSKAAELENIKQLLSIRAIIELSEQRQVVESNKSPKRPVSLLMKRKDAVLR